MNNKLLGLILMVVGGIFAIFITPKILAGGFLNSIYIAAIVLPIALGILLRFRQYWPGLCLLGLNIGWPFHLPPLLDVVASPYLFFPMCILVISIMRAAIQKGGEKWRWRTEDIGMLFCLVISLVWFALDPPGSARMGAEQGGLGYSLGYILAPWMYFLGRSLSKMEPRIAYRNMVLAGISAIYGLAMLIHQYKFSNPGIFFNRQAWMVAAFALAMIVYWEDRRGGRITLAFWIMAVLVLVAGATTPHRSRPVFALAAVLIAASYTLQFKRRAIIILAAGTAGVISLAVVSPSWLPDESKRALSIFRHFDIEGEMRYSEQGWKSEFRARMYREGWRQIRMHPMGKGYGFSTTDLLGALISVAGSREEALEVTGGFHNALMTYALFVGVPAAIVFALLLIQMSTGYWFRTHRGPMTPEKAWQVFLMAYLICVIGQLLMNGGHKEMYTVALLFGLMRKRDPAAGGVEKPVREPEKPIANASGRESTAKLAWSGRPS